MALAGREGADCTPGTASRSTKARAIWRKSCEPYFGGNAINLKACLHEGAAHPGVRKRNAWPHGLLQRPAGPIWGAKLGAIPPAIWRA
jgi:hypothetical protein